MFDNADGQTTDALQYYKLNYEPKGSGELKMGLLLNPTALRVAKTLWSFGHSECNGVIENISPMEEFFSVFQKLTSIEKGGTEKMTKVLPLIVHLFIPTPDGATDKMHFLKDGTNGRHSWVISLSHIHPPRLEKAVRDPFFDSQHSYPFGYRACSFTL